MSETVAIIGFDGLSVQDTKTYDFPGAYEALPIETLVHTCPSWNAIFTGRDRGREEGVFDFWKTPEEPPDDPPAMLARHTDERWSYDDLRTDRYPWERDDVPPVDVVSAPVVLPTYSNIDHPPDTSITWPTTVDEISTAIDKLAAITKGRERVITVFPVPDKCNHLHDNGDKDYDREDRICHLTQAANVARDLADHFDRWVILSDHGKPSAREYIDDTETYWVPSHDPVGVIASNAVPVTHADSLNVYERIIDVLSE